MRKTESITVGEKKAFQTRARMGLLVRNSLRRDPRQQKRALPKPPAWPWVRRVAQLLPLRPAWDLESTGCRRDAGPDWAAAHREASLPGCPSLWQHRQISVSQKQFL